MGIERQAWERESVYHFTLTCYWHQTYTDNTLRKLKAHRQLFNCELQAHEFIWNSIHVQNAIFTLVFQECPGCMSFWCNSLNLQCSSLPSALMNSQPLSIMSASSPPSAVSHSPLRSDLTDTAAFPVLSASWHWNLPTLIQHATTC